MIVLSFLASPGRAYQLLARDRLEGGVWTLLKTVPPSLASVEVRVRDERQIEANTARFYRIELDAFK